jgi:glycosyltransferase involved in cell wall biosynthesis
MKILFITPWYPDNDSPNHGIFVYDQAHAISKTHDVVVIVSKVNYKKFGVSSLELDDRIEQGVRTIRISLAQSFPVFNQLNFFLRTILVSLRIAKEFKPDVIHANIGYPGAFWGWMLSRLIHVPYIVTEHTRPINNFRSLIHRRLTILGLNKASRVITVGSRNKHELLKYINNTVIIIPNIVDLERFKTIRLAEARKEIHLGFIGRLDTPGKGLDVLLKALHEVNRVRQDFILHIGGDGSMRASYERLAKELAISSKCIFHGFIPPDGIPTFMQQLNFFVSASRFETFGLVIVEAMACGMPVIATDCGGPSDFVRSFNGLLIKVDSTSEMKQAILQMMDNYANYNSSKIKEFVMEEFSEKHFVNGINNVYETLTRTLLEHRTQAR